MKINFKLTLLSVIFLSLSNLSQAQVGIGTSTPHSSSQLEINSNNKGFLPPRMTTTERNAIANPAEGLMIFNTTSKSLNIYYNGVWQQVTNTTPVGSISTLTAGSPTGNLIWGVPASGVSSTVAYTGANGETYTGQSIASTGVIGLTATIPNGTFALGDGNLNYSISGTPASSGNATFALNIAGKALSLTRTVDPGTIASLTTGTTNIGSLTGGVVASGVSSVVSYTGGNGGKYNAQTVSSTGVTGLTASLAAGSFAAGDGTLTYNITGTPYAGGIASFALNIGGKTATLTRSIIQPPCGSGYNVTFVYNGSNVTYGTVLGANNRCWLDRNLGATQVATYNSDPNAYGHLFQWGRSGSDRHQIPNSGTTYNQFTTDSPNSDAYVINTIDWRNPPNSNLWQEGTGINNPCPSGWRVPSRTEWETEYASWTGTSYPSYASPLKLPVGDNRSWTGTINAGQGWYWTSTVSSSEPTIRSTYVQFSSTKPTTLNSGSQNRTYGLPVRCIKN